MSAGNSGELRRSPPGWGKFFGNAWACLLQREIQHFCRILALLLMYLAAAKTEATTPGAPANWLNYWSFSDTNGWLSDLGYAPVIFTNLDASPFGNGSALVLDNTNCALLQFNVIEEDAQTNLTVDVGTVMFWFAPYWSGTNEAGAGPGSWGRLFETGSYTSD